MFKSMLFFLVFNGVAGATISVVYTYIASVLTKQSIQEERIEYLCQKICQLEKQINELQAHDSQRELTHAQLQNQLESFINTQYELVE